MKLDNLNESSVNQDGTIKKISLVAEIRHKVLSLVRAGYHHQLEEGLVGHDAWFHLD